MKHIVEYIDSFILKFPSMCEHPAFQRIKVPKINKAHVKVDPWEIQLGQELYWRHNVGLVHKCMKDEAVLAARLHFRFGTLLMRCEACYCFRNSLTHYEEDFGNDSDSESHNHNITESDTIEAAITESDAIEAAKAGSSNDIVKDNDKAPGPPIVHTNQKLEELTP